MYRSSSILLVGALLRIKYLSAEIAVSDIYAMHYFCSHVLSNLDHCHYMLDTGRESYNHNLLF